MFENLSLLLWIEVSILYTIAFIYFLMPIVVWLSYKRCTLWLILASIFLRRTPMPRIILFLNTIEENEWINELLDNQEEILNEIKKLKH